MYRAPTDNDVDAMFHNLMVPYTRQTEENVSTQQTADGWQVVTKITNKRGHYMVTDTYKERTAACWSPACCIAFPAVRKFHVLARRSAWTRF